MIKVRVKFAGVLLIIAITLFNWSLQ